jgi:hypothetical protein
VAEEFAIEGDCELCGTTVGVPMPERITPRLGRTGLPLKRKPTAKEVALELAALMNELMVKMRQHYEVAHPGRSLDEEVS